MIDWYRLALRKDILVMYLKILMTFCVPFCVSTYASVEAARASQ